MSTKPLRAFQVLPALKLLVRLRSPNPRGPSPSHAGPGFRVMSDSTILAAFQVVAGCVKRPTRLNNDTKSIAHSHAVDATLQLGTRTPAT